MGMKIRYTCDFCGEENLEGTVHSVSEGLYILYSTPRFICDKCLKFAKKRLT